MRYLQFDDSGRVISFCSAETLIESGSLPDCMVEAPKDLNSVNAFEYFVNPQTKEVIHAGNSPSFFHRFDPSLGAWIFDRASLERQIRNLINLKKEDELSAPLEVNGVIYDSNSKSLFDIQCTLSLFYFSKTLPENFLWRSQTNQMVSVTYEMLEKLAFAIYERNSKVNQTYWALKDSLESMSSEELFALYNELTNK